MIDFTIFGQLDGVSFSPATVQEEILQNVKTIIATRKGTVPLDRDFGIDWDFIDKPQPVAMAMLSTDVVKQLKKYEPRARLLSIAFEQDTASAMDGKLRPRFSIGVNE